MNDNRNLHDENKKKKSKSIAHRKVRKNDDAASSPDFTKHILSSVGNQDFQKMASGGFIQAKLTSAAAANPFEKQADQVADQMVGNSISDTRPPVINKVQPQAKAPSNLSGETAAGLQNIKGKGSSLNRDLRNYFEPRFGKDLGNVRVHTGNNADKLATDLNARAFTHGNDIVFKGGEFQPGTAKGKKLIAHELTHTVQQGASGVTFQSGPVIQAKGLDETPEEERKGIKAVTDNMKVTTPLTQIFDPAFSGLPFDAAVKGLVAGNVRFSGVDSGLEKGLRQLAGIFWNGDFLPPNSSVTWTARFADEKFVDTNYYKSVSESMQTFFGSYTVFRFTRYQKSDGKGGKSEEMLIEAMGTISKTKEKPSAEETKNYKALFDKYCKIKSGSSQKGAGFKDFTEDEKQMLYKTVAALPESVFSKIAGITFKRRDANPNNPDSAGTYQTAENAIILYDRTFKDQNTLLGNMTQGFHTNTEATIYHEIGHAVDYADLLEASEAVSAATDEYNICVDAFNKALAELNAYVPIYNRILNAANSAIEEYNKQIRKKNGKIDYFNTKYGGKTLTSEEQIAADALKKEIKDCDIAIAEKEKIKIAKEKAFEKAEKKFNELEAKKDALFKKSDEKAADLKKTKEDRTKVTSPSGKKSVKQAGAWDMINGPDKTKFREAANKDGAEKGTGEKVEGAITEYGETNWGEYYAEAFSLFFTDPGRMSLISPNVYKYFNDRYGSNK